MGIRWGLDEDKRYFIPELGLTCSGGALMQVGLLIGGLWGDFATKTLSFSCKD